MLKKRSIIKLFIAVPIVWIVVMLITSLNDTSSSSTLTSSELIKEKQKIERLQRENKRLIEEAAEKHQEERRLRLEKLNAKEDQLKDDHDHPEEERKKVEEEQKGHGPKQVNAPIDRNPNAPGELGKAVVIDKEKLSPDERVKFDEGWKNNAFNQYASDMISLHRSLADIRDPACKAVKWYDPLPSTSVIVIFHNEAWSVLLRTIHSVLDRSDPKLLVEIIVVDDFSDFGIIFF